MKSLDHYSIDESQQSPSHGFSIDTDAILAAQNPVNAIYDTLEQRFSQAAVNDYSEDLYSKADDENIVATSIHHIHTILKLAGIDADDVQAADLEPLFGTDIDIHNPSIGTIRKETFERIVGLLFSMRMGEAVASFLQNSPISSHQETGLHLSNLNHIAKIIAASIENIAERIAYIAGIAIHDVGKTAEAFKGMNHTAKCNSDTDRAKLANHTSRTNAFVQLIPDPTQQYFALAHHSAPDKASYNTDALTHSEVLSLAKNLPVAEDIVLKTLHRIKVTDIAEALLTQFRGYRKSVMPAESAIHEGIASVMQIDPQGRFKDTVLNILTRITQESYLYSDRIGRDEESFLERSNNENTTITQLFGVSRNDYNQIAKLGENGYLQLWSWLEMYRDITYTNFLGDPVNIPYERPSYSEVQKLMTQVLHRMGIFTKSDSSHLLTESSDIVLQPLSVDLFEDLGQLSYIQMLAFLEITEPRISQEARHGKMKYLDQLSQDDIVVIDALLQKKGIQSPFPQERAVA